MAKKLSRQLYGFNNFILCLVASVGKYSDVLGYITAPNLVLKNQNGPFYNKFCKNMSYMTSFAQTVCQKRWLKQRFSYFCDLDL